MARFLRFYCPDLPDGAGASIDLNGDEALHLGKVLRLGPGAEVTLFDGCGKSVTAVVETVTRSKVLLRAAGPSAQSAPRDGLTLAVAPPKRDLDDAIEMLCELGVPRLQPIQSRHGEVLPTDPARLGRYMDRLRKLSIAAAKQCGSDFLLEVLSPTSVAKLPGAVLVCEPSADLPLAQALRDATNPVITIGPEGGWSDAEREHFGRVGWRMVRLPGGVLRTRTAVVVAATIAMEAHAKLKSL